MTQVWCAPVVYRGMDYYLLAASPLESNSNIDHPWISVAYDTRTRTPVLWAVLDAELAYMMLRGRFRDD